MTQMTFLACAAICAFIGLWEMLKGHYGSAAVGIFCALVISLVFMTTVTE
jgi:hypothetical protein